MLGIEYNKIWVRLDRLIKSHKIWEKLFLDPILREQLAGSSHGLNTFDGFSLNSHLNLSEIRKNHQLPPVVSSSILIRLQSFWYLSWLALSETFEYGKSYVRR